MPASEPCPTVNRSHHARNSMTQTSHHPSATAPDPEPVAPGLSRRAVVTGVGGVAAVGLLTACGGGATPTAPPPPPAGAPAPPPPPAATAARAPRRPGPPGPTPRHPRRGG